MSSGASVKARHRYNPRQDQSRSKFTTRIPGTLAAKEREISPDPKDKPSSSLALEERAFEQGL